MRTFLRKLIVVICLILLLGILTLINIEFSSIYLDRGFFSLLAVTIVYSFFKILVEEILIERVKDYKVRYTLRKTSNILFLLISLLFILGIWIDNTQAIVVAYGLLAAGIAISLQDLFKGFTGGILILVNNLYRVGDRVQIGNVHGDVMDISVLYTTMMETRGWVQGDQATGRILMVSNSKVITDVVRNYTKDHSFLWDEIVIPLTFDSNWEDMISPVLDITRKEVGQLTEKATKEIARIGEKYYLPKRDVEPAVYVSFDNSWINLHIRYVTEAKKRRYYNDRISKMVLKEAADHKDVKIAQAQIESWKLGEAA